MTYRRELPRLSLVLAAGLLACSRTEAPPSPEERVILSTNQEILARFHDPDAKAVVANFWATWCVPCREEMPELIRFYKEYSPKGVAFVSVSVDDPAAPGDDLIPFMDEMGIPFSVWVPEKNQSPADLIGSLDPNWGGGIPATFVFDPSGAVVEKWFGPVNFDDLVAVVNPLLAG